MCRVFYTIIQGKTNYDALNNLKWIYTIIVKWWCKTHFKLSLIKPVNIYEISHELQIYSD